MSKPRVIDAEDGILYVIKEDYDELKAKADKLADELQQMRYAVMMWSRTYLTADKLAPKLIVGADEALSEYRGEK